MEKGLYKLIIDDDIASVFPNRAAKDEELLIKQLCQEGCRDDLVTWNGIIIDGHTRYRICHEYGIPFSYQEMPFPSKERAKLWMIENQIARRNLTVFQRCVIVLPLEQAYKEEAEERRREKISVYRKNGELPQKSAVFKETRDVLADLAGASHDTIAKVKYILKNGSDELKEEVSRGDKSIHKAYTLLKTQEPPEEDDYDDSEDQKLLEKIRAMPKENTTDPRADDTVRDEVQIPTEEIGGYEPVVYQKSPITVSEEPIKRIPGDFYYVEEQVRSSMRNMLDDLKIGLCWLRDEDCNRRDEIISIIDEGFAEAKKLIEKETRRII